MNMTDPIADLLTRIRNANSARHEEVLVPSSRMKLDIVRILKNEGYLENFQKVEDAQQGMIRVALKYGPNKEKVITKLERISKPGRRIYVGKDQVPRVVGGLGVAILSTSKGIMTDVQARKLGVGGELLCQVS